MGVLVQESHPEQYCHLPVSHLLVCGPDDVGRQEVAPPSEGHAQTRRKRQDNSQQQATPRHETSDVLQNHSYKLASLIAW